MLILGWWGCNCGLGLFYGSGWGAGGGGFGRVVACLLVLGGLNGMVEV